MTARTKNSDLADVLELLLACRISPHEFHSMVADAQETLQYPCRWRWPLR
jgi:hypothetical protein